MHEREGADMKRKAKGKQEDDGDKSKEPSWAIPNTVLPNKRQDSGEKMFTPKA